MVSVNDSGSCSDSDMDEYDSMPMSNGNPLDRNYMTDYVANNQHSNPKTVRNTPSIYFSLSLTPLHNRLIINHFCFFFLSLQLQYAFAKNYVSPSASTSSSSQSAPMYRTEHKSSTATNATANNHHTPTVKKVPIDPSNLYTEILTEIKRANALADLEREETNFLHKEMKDLEQQRFHLTQLFVEKSLSLQQQMLKCLQENNGMRTPVVSPDIAAKRKR